MSALRKASTDMTWRPVGHSMWAKCSSRPKLNPPSRKVAYPCSLRSPTSTVVSVAVIGDSSFPAASGRLADVGPAVHGVGPVDGLEQDHAGPLGGEPVAAARGEQRHVAPAGGDAAHAGARGLAGHRHRALGAGVDVGLR